MADQTGQNPVDLKKKGAQTQGGGTSGGTGTQGSSTTSLFEKFDIPETVRNKYPDLIPLILETESMNDDERQYWFQILPIMTEEQVSKLREILVNEKSQLSQIDREYDKEMKRINTKHVSEWKEFEAKQKREKLKSAEVQAQEKEKAEEEGLLKKLHEL